VVESRPAIIAPATWPRADREQRRPGLARSLLIFAAERLMAARIGPWFGDRCAAWRRGTREAFSPPQSAPGRRFQQAFNLARISHAR
jgi:hypothetical protein